MYKNREDANAAARRMYRRHAHTVRSRFRTLKKSAKRKGIPLTLTLEQYTAVVQNAGCFYCGDSLPKVGYGLDRRKYLDGYNASNVVPCCTPCNRLKGRMEASGVSLEAVIKIAEVVWGRGVDSVSPLSTRQG